MLHGYIPTPETTVKMLHILLNSHCSSKRKTRREDIGSKYKKFNMIKTHTYWFKIQQSHLH
jgi:hypothetical protein